MLKVNNQYKSNSLPVLKDTVELSVDAAELSDGAVTFSESILQLNDVKGVDIVG